MVKEGVNIWEDPNFGDPQLEDMVNFRNNLPGGFYNPTQGTRHAQTIGSIIDELSPYFEKPSSEWPAEEAEDIRSIRTKVEIRRAIEEFLANNERIAGWWSDWAGKYRLGMNPNIQSMVEKEIIRPIYVAMREKFTQEDLVS